MYLPNMYLNHFVCVDGSSYALFQKKTQLFVEVLQASDMFCYSWGETDSLTVGCSGPRQRVWIGQRLETLLFAKRPLGDKGIAEKKKTYARRNEVFHTPTCGLWLRCAPRCGPGLVERHDENPCVAIDPRYTQPSHDEHLTSQTLFAMWTKRGTDGCWTHCQSKTHFKKWLSHHTNKQSNNTVLVNHVLS